MILPEPGVSGEGVPPRTKLECGLPTILFVCRHNACRSRIAEAIAKGLAPASWVIASAGSHPTAETDPKAAQILERHGLDMDGARPKGICELSFNRWDYVVDISCEKAGGRVQAKNYVEWDLADPLDGPMETYEALFTELNGRIRDLFRAIKAGLEEEREDE